MDFYDAYIALHGGGGAVVGPRVALGGAAPGVGLVYAGHLRR